MTVNEILDLMDELLEKSWGLPLSGGKSLVDHNHLADLINDVRLNLPSEIKHAKMIVSDRTQIIDDAKKEAENVIRIAEQRAKKMVSEQEVVEQAQQKANEIISNAHMQAKELRRTATEFIDEILQHLEETLAGSLSKTREVRQNFRKMNIKGNPKS